MELYLLNVKSVTYIRAIARFRLSSHHLQIELGRHSKPKLPLALRICHKCNNGDIEDRTHFLVDCPFYAYERSLLFSAVKPYLVQFYSMNSLQMFVNIMSSREKYVINAVGRFLHKCMVKTTIVNTTRT